MADQIQGAREDLAFMRGLVQEGDVRDRAQGGRIMAAGGVIFATCSLVEWAAAMGWLPATPWIFAGAWGAAMVVFLVVLMVNLAGKAEAKSVKSRASGILWSAVGMAIGAVVVSCIGVQYSTGSGVVWAMLPSVVFSLYGAGWTVAATLSGRMWERLVGVGAFAAAVAIAFAAGTSFVYLAYAVGLFLLATVPGFLMMRDQRA